MCTIYKGTKERELYVYVASDSDPDIIPDELKQRMGAINEVMSLEVTPGRKLARANAVQVLAAIREKGYYLQLPPEITGAVLFDGD